MFQTTWSLSMLLSLHLNVSIAAWNVVSVTSLFDFNRESWRWSCSSSTSENPDVEKWPKIVCCVWNRRELMFDLWYSRSQNHSMNSGNVIKSHMTWCTRFLNDECVENIWKNKHIFWTNRGWKVIHFFHTRNFLQRPCKTDFNIVMAVTYN